MSYIASLQKRCKGVMVLKGHYRFYQLTMAYHSQLGTRTQLSDKSIQVFSSASEQFALRPCQAGPLFYPEGTSM
jgi:hypothetical protein